MPIITKPAAVDKNSPAEISLDKSALANVASVLADDYFSDSDNWKEVFIYYKSSTGNQREILKFNAELASPTANFLVSDKALDIFEVQKIVIVDFDSGNITIPRSELTVADFDVDMSAQAGATIVWDTFISGFTLGADGAISKAGAVSDYGYCPRSSVGLSGDFELTFEALDTDLLNGWCVGASTSISDNPENGLNQCIFYYDLGNLYIYKQGGFITGPLSLASGNNVFKMVRTSDIMSFFLNGSPVSVSSSSFSGTVYPEARVGGAVKKATVISAVTPIVWVNPAPDVYNIEADGGLTNGVNRGGITYYTITADSQIFNDDFEIIYNVGVWAQDSIFGVRTILNGLYAGSVGYGGGTSNNIHVNDLAVGVISSGLSGKQWKIKRVGATTSFYTDGVLDYSTTNIVGPVKPMASLNAGGGTLISATIE